MFYYNIVHYAAVCLYHNIISKLIVFKSTTLAYYRGGRVNSALDHTTIPQGAKSQSETAVLVVLWGETG